MTRYTHLIFTNAVFIASCIFLMKDEDINLFGKICIFTILYVAILLGFIREIKLKGRK